MLLVPLQHCAECTRAKGGLAKEVGRTGDAGDCSAMPVSTLFAKLRTRGDCMTLDMAAAGTGGGWGERVCGPRCPAAEVSGHVHERVTRAHAWSGDRSQQQA